MQRREPLHLDGGSFSRAGSLQKASIRRCGILQAENWVGVCVEGAFWGRVYV